MSLPRREPAVLGYYHKRAKKSEYRLAHAVSLCLPGIFCWMVLLIRGGDFAICVLWLWPVAIITAIWSFLLYVPRSRGPRPWYVWLCLCLNAIGIGFSGLMVFVFFP